MTILTSSPTLAQVLLPHVPFGWKLTSWQDPATWDTVIQLIRTGGPVPVGQRFSHRVSRQALANDYQTVVPQIYAWIQTVTKTAAADWPEEVLRWSEEEEVLLTEAAKGVGVSSDQRDLTHSVIRNLAVPKGWSITTWDDAREIVVELRHTGWSGQHRHRLGEEEILNGSDLAYEKVVAWVTSIVWPGWVPGMEMETVGGGGVGTGQGPVIVPRRKVEPTVEVAPGARRIDLDD